MEKLQVPESPGIEIDRAPGFVAPFPVGRVGAVPEQVAVIQARAFRDPRIKRQDVEGIEPLQDPGAGLAEDGVGESGTVGPVTNSACANMATCSAKPRVEGSIPINPISRRTSWTPSGSWSWRSSALLR